MTGTPSLPSAVALEDVLRRGREALAEGRVDGALETFDDALRIKPTYAPAWRAKGRALRASGDAEAALACYAEALRNEPDDEASWFGLALTLHALGRPRDEVQAYDEILRRNPGHIAAWMNRGVALHESREYEEALRCYDRILELRPEFAPAWNDRGAALIRLGRPEEALAAFDEALGLDPSFEDAASNRRTVLKGLKRDTPAPPPYTFPPRDPLPQALDPRVRANLGLPAVAAWRRVRPEDPEDYVALGTALLDEGTPGVALSAFRKAGPSPAAALGALIAMERSAHPRLLEGASSALAAHPDKPRVAAAVARIRESSGDLDGASEAIAGLLARRPGLAWTWSWRGLLALRRGSAAAAAEHFERATAGDPGDVDAWAGLAAALHLEGRTEDALVACDRALAIDPDHGAARNNRGVILAAKGDREGADVEFRAALKAAGDVTAMLNRALLAESGRGWRSALKLYEKVLAREPDDRAAAAGKDRASAALRDRRRVSRKTLLSRLESIPGIGPTSAGRVVDAGFDTTAKVRRATVTALRRAGLTAAQARAVRSAFRT